MLRSSRLSLAATPAPSAPRRIGATRRMSPPATLSSGLAGKELPLSRCSKKGLSVARGRGRFAAQGKLRAVVASVSATEQTAEVAKAFKKLQNGSDIRGVALEGVEGQSVNLTDGKAFYIGMAFGEWLRENHAKEGESIRVSIGMDPRLSGEKLTDGLMKGLAAAGADPTFFGLATTPAMFMSTITEGYKMTGAIMVTASHLPFNRNGFKFFASTGGLEKRDITWILDRASLRASQAGGDLDSLHNATSHHGGKDCKPSKVKFMDVYAEQLRTLIKKGVKHPEHFDQPLKGLRIVVDAGNGSGGYFARDVLEPLGADITGSQFLDPDGSFPNHIPNPEDAEAMEATTKAVLDNKADLGICFDTDVDRSGVVDSSGKQINSNKYIALMAAIALEDYPGTTIVTDSVTSSGLTAFIESLGGKHFRYRRGYKNVIGKGVELNAAGENCELMMETSGHGAMKENYFLDDGAYSAVKSIIKLVRLRMAGKGSVADLLVTLAEALESREFRLKIQAENFQDIGKEVLSDFHDMIEAKSIKGWSLDAVNHEGWRVNIDEGNGKKGWALLRQSLHDPLMVLNVESDVPGGAAATASKIHEFLQKYDKVDSSVLIDAK